MRRTFKDERAGKIIGKLYCLDSSQKELAKYCGYSPEYVCDILRGKRRNEGALKRLEVGLEGLEHEIRAQ